MEEGSRWRRRVQAPRERTVRVWQGDSQEQEAQLPVHVRDRYNSVLRSRFRLQDGCKVSGYRSLLGWPKRDNDVLDRRGVPQHTSLQMGSHRLFGLHVDIRAVPAHPIRYKPMGEGQLLGWWLLHTEGPEADQRRRDEARSEAGLQGGGLPLEEPGLVVVAAPGSLHPGREEEPLRLAEAQPVRIFPPADLVLQGLARLSRRVVRRRPPPRGCGRSPRRGRPSSRGTCRGRGRQDGPSPRTSSARCGSDGCDVPVRHSGTAPIIMMSQNRAAARDEVLASHHYDETHTLDELLQSNNDMTQQVHELSQKIHELAAQIALHTCAPGPVPHVEPAQPSTPS